MTHRPPDSDPLDSSTSEFDWGRRRFDGARAYVSGTTIGDWIPFAAIAVGAAIVVTGAALLWTSFGVSADMVSEPGPAPPSTVFEPDQTAASSDASVSDQAPPRLADQTAEMPLANEVEVTVIVHVSGRVARPGIVELTNTSRVFHAVELAGGPLADADLDRINLAAAVVDGSQIHIPTIAASEATVEGTPNSEPTVSDLGAVDPDTSDSPATPTVASEDLPEVPHVASPEQDSPAAPSDDSDTRTASEQDTDALLAELELLAADRATALTPAEVQAKLRDAGLGLPIELEAALATLDAPPTDAELRELFVQFGLDS